METKFQLKDDTIEMLNRLIEANLDSKNGYEQAAESIDNEGLSDLFESISEKRQSQARQLRQYVKQNGKEAEDDGTTRGALHNTWVKARAAINSGDEEVVLIEVCRGEKHIKELYEDLLKDNPASALSDVLHQHYKDINADYEQVYGWRKRFD